MAGICKYCGFSGTNDQMSDHAGEMCQGDFQPDGIEQNLNSPQQTKAIICPNCSGEGKDMRNGSKHCEYCDFWW